MSARKTALVLAFAGLFSAAAHAGPSCNEPKETWIPEADFKARLEAEGYQIKKFKVEDNCYEIYGTNKEGKKVEVYFNPATGEVLKSAVED